MPTLAVLYLRSSKDKSDISIAAQRRALHELAASRGLVICDEYADAVESGKDEDRPAFQRLLRDLRRPGRTWSQVLALDTSRIARRRHLALIFEHECERQRVQIVYRNVPDTDPITTMLLKSILQAMDEWHSLTSRAKGLAGMAENVRQGWRAGGRAPRGYQLEEHATGAIRDGHPVTKTRLVPDPELAPLVTAYLSLRAQGVSRGQAISRLQLPWPASSVHSMDWQALTYAGHTAWNVHAEREGGRSVTGEKRRPRSEWLVQRHTHEPLITDDQAEAILVQVEKAQIGRRRRASPLLFSGLVVAPDGTTWHSDGSGCYRYGKGRKISAKRLERALLARIEEDVMDEEAIEVVRAALADVGDEIPTPQRIQGLERRIRNLTAQIGRTVDLAAKIEDPAPVLRRVEDLEHSRAVLIEELTELRAAAERVATADQVTLDDVRVMLRRMFEEMATLAEAGDVAPARQALGALVERVVLEPTTLTAHVDFCVDTTGDKVASRRGRRLSPVRWRSVAISLQKAA